MIDLKHITGSVIESAKHIHDRFAVLNPAREWVIGICISLVLFVSGVGYALFVFSQVLEDPADSVTVETVTYKHESVKKALELYRTRRETTAQILGLPPPPAVVEEKKEETAPVAGQAPLSVE